ncbi:hypothetical protein BUALT_BualtUnG0053100 [Buddleja alternifolia]|uniref:pectinesterase n=1 Tax=Buddleja alternifolia TaxID=168488 RepID=A0AAV6W0W3_9LAMI|nr:hypothetical protein BUALT_BualtUnG0053100 [Buddleja alternifolia]
MAKSIISAIVFFVAAAAAISMYLHFHQPSSSRKSGNIDNPCTPPPESRKFDATVSSTRPGAFKTVMEALQAAPVHATTKYVIHIEAGTYNELVVVWKNRTNIWLVGDGAEVTKITMDRSYPTFSTYETATFSVQGEGFVAKDIAFENSAGPGSQAVALLSEASTSAFFRCIFLGYQDTLYSKSGRQFYRECDIYGNVDFIFGDESRAIFQNCNIFARLPKLVYFTAQGRSLLQSSSGFVFQNSSFTVASDMQLRKEEFVAYLGRPWFEYSTVVIMECYIDDIISPLGWGEWPPKPTDKLTYIEYKNRGPGANVNERVNWTGYHALDRPDESRCTLSSSSSREMFGCHQLKSHTILV